MVEEGE